MEIPKSLKIGGHVITIQLHDSQTIGGQGEYNSYYQLIRLRDGSDIAEDIIAETLLHEIVEAVRHQNNLNIDHTHLTVLSESLFAVIRNNGLDFRLPGQKRAEKDGEGQKRMEKMDRELIMKQWDTWRKYIAEGGKASWPRDAFESLLDHLLSENPALAQRRKIEPLARR